MVLSAKKLQNKLSKNCGSHWRQTLLHQKKLSKVFPCLDLRLLLHRVLRPRLRGQPALVPHGGQHQLPRDHLLQPLLPLPCWAPQQTRSQLVDGGKCHVNTKQTVTFPTPLGVLVHRRCHLLLLHGICLHPGRFRGLGVRGVPVLGGRQHRRRGEKANDFYVTSNKCFYEMSGVRTAELCCVRRWILPHLHGLEGQPHRLCRPRPSHRLVIILDISQQSPLNINCQWCLNINPHPRCIL